jgi:mycothiol synthase
MIIDEHQLPGLYMLWPASRFPNPLHLSAPPGYDVRTYRQGDDADLLELLSIDGERMTNEQWKEYKDKILPNGLYLVYQTATNRLVATAGALHNPNPGRYYFPFGSELGYLIVHTEHRGQGLGRFVSALVVDRLLSAGYESIRVGVQGFRLPAIKIYLQGGFAPFLHHEDLYLRWERICRQLNWPYQPEEWPTKE